MNTESDDLIRAAGDFASALLDAVAREHPELRADVERAVAGGATLVVEVRLDAASVTAALVVRAADGRSAEIANVNRLHGSTH